MTAANPYTAPTATVNDTLELGTHTPKLHEFNGRIGRIQYLAFSFLSSLLLMIPMALSMAVMFNAEGNRLVMGIGMVGISIASVYAIAIGIANMKRRLNDLDKSGWLMLLFFIPLVNFIFALYVIFAKGTEGANNFGAAPSQPTTTQYVLFYLQLGLVVLSVILTMLIPSASMY